MGTWSSKLPLEILTSLIVVSGFEFSSLFLLLLIGYMVAADNASNG